MSTATGPERGLFVHPKSGYREIITKAVCGTAKKILRYSQQFPTVDGSEPVQILGTSITQMRLKEPEIEADNGTLGVRVNGIFEAHIWYSYNGGRSTDLLRQAIHFEEVVPVTEHDGLILSITDAKANIIKPPQTQEAGITRDGRIKVDFELGVYVEVIGETKLLVKVASPEDL
ncbi:MAG: outer spore coat protein CotE [Peptococcaceae bacterium]|nr:outer spore coat protein CotE [Peptococcaceae bacterium]